MPRPPFRPSPEYLRVLLALEGLTNEELNRLKLQDIHRLQMERLAVRPDPEKPVGTNVVIRV